MFGPFPGSRVGPGRGIIRPYLGQGATRCFLHDSTFGSTTGWNSRTAHYARTAMYGPMPIYSNYWCNAGSGDAGASGTKTITAKIEFPANVFTPLTWKGAPSYTIQSSGLAIPDRPNVFIPEGALFWTKLYQVNSTNLLYLSHVNSNPALGDIMNNSGVDETGVAAGSMTQDGHNSIMAPPCAIVAMTTSPSIAAFLDSRTIGVGDTVVDATGDTGYARFFGDKFAYLNYGIGGDTVTALANLSTKRFALARAFCSHLFIAGGINDLGSPYSVSAAGVNQGLSDLINLWPDRSKVIVGDIAPDTTSTDNWATTTNQSTGAAETGRQAVNALIDAYTGVNQIVKINAADLNSGSASDWLVNGTANYSTPDGVHENTAQLLRMKAAGIFNPALITL